MKGFSKRYDFLKVITTVLVVLAHVTRMYTGEGVITPYNSSSVLAHVTRFIYAFHMPLFIAISGAVYGFCIDNLNKYKDKKQFIKNKAKRLMLPYLVFGLLYVAPIMVIFDFTDMNFLEYSVKGILCSMNPRHLWYLISLFCIFLVCAFLRDRIQKANVAVCLIVTFLISYISNKHYISYFQITSTLYYVFYFYVGYLINRYSEKMTEGIHKYRILLPLCPVLIILGMKFHQLKYVAAMAGIIMMLAISLGVTDNVYDNKIYLHLKKNSFGVYLFHPMIIYVLFYYLGTMDINPFLLSGIIFVVSYVVSDLLTEVIRKIKLGLLLGE